MLVHLVKKGVFQRVSRSKQSSISKEASKVLVARRLCKGFCKCKCFANPLARRMVRYLKEKDDGGTTGGLSSAGTPHNNFCVHPAVHFRQGGGGEGVRGRQPQPSKNPFAAICRSACRTIDSHQLEVGRGFPLCVYHTAAFRRQIPWPSSIFVSRANKSAMRSEFHKAPLR